MHQDSLDYKALEDAQKRWQLASEELLRMEEEGGISLSLLQIEKAASYARSSRRLRQLLSTTNPTSSMAIPMVRALYYRSQSCTTPL